MAKVKITETVLRDSHQSLVATRMTTDEMLPILISEQVDPNIIAKIIVDNHIINTIPIVSVGPVNNGYI